MEELEYMREIYDFPPELDFCSDSFDPLCALNSYIHLPFPNAKTYNNLAEYYSHTFLKKDDLRKVEKDRPYDRDYSYYYATLGLDSKAQERGERRRLDKIKRMKYAGWRSAKLKKKLPKLDDDPNREPCRNYPPLQSTKIIQISSSLRKRKIFPIINSLNTSPETSLENQLNEFIENEIKEDNNPASHRNGERPSKMSIIKSDQETFPHTFDSPSVVHSRTNFENQSNDFKANTKDDRNYTSHQNEKRPSKMSVGDSPSIDHSKTNSENQLNDSMKNGKRDRNYTSHQNEKRPSKMSVGDSGQEKHSQTFDSPSANHFVSKYSRHQQRFLKNYSYDYKRKYENKYRQHPRSSFKQSNNSHFRKDSRQDYRDPRLRKNKRFS